MKGFSYTLLTSLPYLWTNSGQFVHTAAAAATTTILHSCSLYTRRNYYQLLFNKHSQLPFSTIQSVLIQSITTFGFPVFTFKHLGFHADYYTLAHSPTFCQQYHIICIYSLADNLPSLS